jgi:hypothetical protein
LQLRAIALSASVMLEQNTQCLYHHQRCACSYCCFGHFGHDFGTRQIANTEQHGGLMLAVAFESFVKLFALLCVHFFYF